MLLPWNVSYLQWYYLLRWPQYQYHEVWECWQSSHGHHTLTRAPSSPGDMQTEILYSGSGGHVWSHCQCHMLPGHTGWPGAAILFLNISTVLTVSLQTMHILSDYEIQKYLTFFEGVRNDHFCISSWFMIILSKLS